MQETNRVRSMIQKKTQPSQQDMSSDYQGPFFLLNDEELKEEVPLVVQVLQKFLSEGVKRKVKRKN